jgi:4-hydroxyacetophenone monooxygenase
MKPAYELLTATDAQIREAVAYADPLTLRGTLYHLTGDDSLAGIPHVAGPGLLGDASYITDGGSIDLLRKKACEFLVAYRDGDVELPAEASRDRLLKAMGLVVCGDAPEQDADFWLQELALDPIVGQMPWTKADTPKEITTFEVVVIGSGLAGVNAAIQLDQAGFPFVLFEKNAGVGGTWHQNRYPGARVDFPSRVYSHAFGVNYPFEYQFAPQAENEKYINWCVDHFGVRDRIRFDTEVLAMSWREDDGCWEIRVRAPDGVEYTVRARAVISAVGFLDRASTPEVEGLQDFVGNVMHTARFDTDLDFDGRRVALVGTGASGMQVMPELAKKVAHLTVFQRSPAWVIPAPGYRDPLPEPARWLNRNLPFYNNWTRFNLSWQLGDPTIYECWTVDPEWTDPDTLNAHNYAMRQRLIAHLEAKLADRPDLLEKCLPPYPPLSKRFVLDNGWFDALLQDNVDLVTDGIARFEADGIVTKSGDRIEVDTVVFATGFRANEYFWPMEIVGRHGMTPQKIWAKDGARAYWGVTVPHLPNFFVLYGPNTNPKNAGPIPWGGVQIRHALQCMHALAQNGWRSVEVREDAYESFNGELDERMSTTIWMDPRQRSYYTNEHGRSATNAPWATIEYWRRLREVRWDDYVVTAADGQVL